MESEGVQTNLLKNSEGDMYVDLGKKKRVTVRSFKGKPHLLISGRVNYSLSEKGVTLVDIREYYVSEGNEKPGKKGISLNVEQVRRRSCDSLQWLRTVHSGKALWKHQEPSAISCLQRKALPSHADSRSYR
jgi:hypothetical protein